MGFIYGKCEPGSEVIRAFFRANPTQTKAMLEIPIFPGVTEARMAIICERFNCKFLGKSKNGCYWKIEFTDPVDVFWLGMNLPSKINE